MAEIKSNRKYIMVLIIIWLAFVIWEIAVFFWAKKEEGPIIRADLVILLPILVGISIWCLYKIFKNA